MPEQTQAEELTELLKNTVDADVQWGSPVVYLSEAVAAVLERWTLTPKVSEHTHSWVDSLDGDMKCSTCGAEHHYTF